MEMWTHKYSKHDLYATIANETLINPDAFSPQMITAC